MTNTPFARGRQSTSPGSVLRMAQITDVITWLWGLLTKVSKPVYPQRSIRQIPTEGPPTEHLPVLLKTAIKTRKVGETVPGAESPRRHGSSTEGGVLPGV